MLSIKLSFIIIHIFTEIFVWGYKVEKGKKDIKCILTNIAILMFSNCSLSNYDYANHVPKNVIIIKTDTHSYSQLFGFHAYFLM